MNKCFNRRSECARFFGRDSILPLTADDGVICDTSNSKVVPLENGEVMDNACLNMPVAGRHMIRTYNLNTLFSRSSLSFLKIDHQPKTFFLLKRCSNGHVPLMSDYDFSGQRHFWVTPN